LFLLIPQTMFMTIDLQVRVRNIAVALVAAPA
jgi:hypothetical protein